MEIIPKEFALRWQIPESSVYEAIAKLKQLGILNIKTGKLVIEWASSQQEEFIDCQQDSDSGNPEKILGIQKKFWESRKNSGNPKKNSEIPEKQPPELALAKDSDSAHTLKTYLDLNTLSEDERENFKAFCKRKADQLPTRVVLLDSWIKKHFEELHAEYQLIYGDKSSARSKPSITKGKNWEKVNAAMKTGELKDTYYSDLYKCDCVVLLNGTVIPLEEWVNAAGRKN